MIQVKDAELEQEKRIQEAVEKIEALNNQDKHASLSTVGRFCVILFTNLSYQFIAEVGEEGQGKFWNLKKILYL